MKKKNRLKKQLKELESTVRNLELHQLEHGRLIDNVFNSVHQDILPQLKDYRTILGSNK